MLHIPAKSRLRNALRGTFLRKIYHLHKHRGLTGADAFLAGYGRCGSTWLAFMLSEVLWKVGSENSLGGHRFTPFVGYHHQAETRLPSGGRLISTHESYRREYQRAICLVRDPRDAAVSTYYHVQRTMGMRGDFSDFLPLYMKGILNGHGQWSRHVESWLDAPLWKDGNAILTRYEDLKASARQELRRLAEFLGHTPTDNEIASAINVSSLDAMRNREATGSAMTHRERGGDKIHAVRKGVVGDWRNHFTAADLEKFYAVNAPLMQRLGYSTGDLDAAPVESHARQRA